MSYANQAKRIQQYINLYPNTGRTHPVLRYLNSVSAANTALRMEDITFLRAQGKKRTLQINYYPIQCDVEGECGQALCTTGTEIEPIEETFDITQCTATKKWTLSLNNLRSLDPDEWDINYVVRMIVETAMPAARLLLATDQLTYLLTKVGIHTDGNATKTINLINSRTGAINPLQWLKVEQEYMDAGQGQPYSLGGGQVFSLTRLQGRAGLNDAGVDTGAVQVPNIWYDENLILKIKGDGANGNYVLAIDPRMFKMISYINNAGMFRTDLDTLAGAEQLFKGRTGPGRDFILGTVTDPVEGIIWDLYMNFDKCTQQWSFHLEHQWDMFVMPPINCNRTGYNGITLWRLCPEREEPCDTGGVSPVSPVANITYTATPDLAQIPTISQSSIGGYTNNQEDPVVITTVQNLVDFMNANYYQPIFVRSGSNITYSGAVDLTVTFNNGDYTLNFA